MGKTLPTAIESVANSGTARGEAVLFFDLNDRLIFTNHYARSKLHFVNLTEEPLFDDIVRTVARGGMVDIPPYLSLEEYITLTNKVRKERPRHTFARRYGDAGLYLVRHERLDGHGSIQFRTQITHEDTAWSAVKELVMRYALEPTPPPGSPAQPLQWNASFSNVLDLMADPTVLLSRDGRIQTYSPSLVALLNQTDLVKMTAGRLRLKDAAADSALQAAAQLHGACHISIPSTLMRVGGRGQETLVALITRIPWPYGQTVQRQDVPAIAVRFIGTLSCSQALDSVLATTFELSGDEHEFAVHYCKTPYLHTVADQLQISTIEAEAIKRKILTATGFSNPIEFVVSALTISERVRRFSS